MPNDLQIHPVSLNESSLRVGLLHKALKTLGFLVSDNEVNTHTVGEDTLRQVRQLQQQLNIKPDERYVIDQKTDEAIKNKMITEGLIDRESTFVVQGIVYRSDSEIVRDQEVIAFDVDLKGAAIYRTATSLKELEENGGLEYLSKQMSDVRGTYYIEFFDFQYASLERKKADVVVYAVNDNGEIIGRSRLVNTEAYSAVGEVTDLHVLVSRKEARTEYDILMEKLMAFLKESDVRLIDLAKSEDQVIFCSTELDQRQTNIAIAVGAELLRTINEQDRASEDCNCEALSHELLYGIGRQNIGLSWPDLYRRTGVELTAAIETSVNEKIIRKFGEEDIVQFLHIIHNCAAGFVLSNFDEGTPVSLSKMLSSALPNDRDQRAFLNAFRNFKNEVRVNETIDYEKFWGEYLPTVNEFKEKPELIQALLLQQQLLIVTGGHQPLIEELQVNRKVSSGAELLKYDNEAWKEIISRTGVPEGIEGNNDQEKVAAYAKQMQSLLQATYPTQQIALMIERNELSVKNQDHARIIRRFIDANASFKIGSSPVHEYAEELKSIAQEQYNDVKRELFVLQRIFQVSPTPEAMRALMDKGLHSAYSIASFPKKSFIKTFGKELGGEPMAEAVYQRAEHISTLAAERAMKMYDLSHLVAPALAYSQDDRQAALDVLQKQVSKRHNPDYSEIFGSPDICECDHCRSVYGAASYFVDLLRFLWRGAKNDDISAAFPSGKSPLDKFEERRPDLLHLPLTCENTNTLIPYIDLVNEVMEYYTAYGHIDQKAGYDTGDATPDELRANPQNFVLKAYQNLTSAVYPFSLPYHQPLDVIRTYSDHLKTPRYDIMKGMQKDFSPAATMAIECEALRISEEEFIVLTGKKYDGTNVTRQLQEYYGFPPSLAADPTLDPVVIANLEKLSGVGSADGVCEFLKRTGVRYTELVDLMKTQFINPGQNVLEYLLELFVNSKLSSSDIYNKLKQVNAGTLNPVSDADLMTGLTAASIAPADFIDWVTDHFDDFNGVITLYQSESACDINTTYLRTIENVYSAVTSSGISNATWSKIHRFIRLWRQLGWTIHETDLMLTSLGQTDITAGTVSQLSYAVLLKSKLKLDVDQLAAIWGCIDTWGDKSLYKKLFLNKAVQRIDTAFMPDEFGKFLTDATAVLQHHIPAMLSAYRMSENDLKAIIDSAEIVSDDTITPHLTRKIDLTTDKLNIHNLSLIYRYTAFSKALKLKVSDFCLLTKLFTRNPFSRLFSVFGSEAVFKDIATAETFKFVELADAIKKSGFKADVLQYIFYGVPSLKSNQALDFARSRIMVKDIRNSFGVIEQNYPERPAPGLTNDVLSTYFSYTYSAEAVSQLKGIIASQQTFSVLVNPGLAIVMPASLGTKFKYNLVTGTLVADGMMADSERVALKALVPGDVAFADAVDSLFNKSRTIPADSFAYTQLTDKNLAITIPDSLSPKYTYTKASGRLTCKGVMSDTEKGILKGLTASPKFKDDVDALYAMPANFIEGSLGKVFASPTCVVHTTPKLKVNIPSAIAKKISYDQDSGALACIGAMTNAEKLQVSGLTSDVVFKDSVDRLFGLSASSKPASAVLLNHPAQSIEVPSAEKMEFLYLNYAPLLKKKMREDTIIQFIASLTGLTQEAARILAGDNLPSMIESVSKRGYSAEYFSNKTLTGSPTIERIDNEIHFDWQLAAPDPLIPADSFSVRWKAYVSSPSSGDYTLIVNVTEADEAFKLYLDDILILEKPPGDVRISWEVIAPVNASQLHKLTLEYLESVANAHVSIYWGAAAASTEVIPASSTFPITVVEAFVDQCDLLQRAARLINGFRLSDVEVNHFVKYKANFDNIDFTAPTATHWQRLFEYTQARSSMPQSQALLTDVFVAANAALINNPSPTPAQISETLDALINQFVLASAYNLSSVTDLVRNFYVFGIDDFKNEKAILRIGLVMDYLRRTGLSSQTLAQWAAPETNFVKLDDTANLVKNAVKAKYEEADWMKLAGDLSDKIRENQKQALINYLVTKQELIDWGVKDPDGLFEYFLIDVQMGACMDTSRIVQANAAIQMFVNRCLLNLESIKVAGLELGVSPDAIDKDRWQWMQSYRVWEVNRKIFLYPENWLEPEWRDDKSTFFKEMESELTQTDITDRSVETAFRNYLTKLNTVANLDVCGLFQENDAADRTMKMLHVFGRTHNSPYQFFYRTCNEFYKWSAWTKVPVDIRMTEDGHNSGVHLAPVVWKNRLFIFWGEFSKKQKEKTATNNNKQDASFEEISKKAPSSVKPLEHFEVHLAWSEYIDGKWSAKQLAKEFIEISATEAASTYSLKLGMRPNNDLVIVVTNKKAAHHFVLSDIQSQVGMEDSAALAVNPNDQYSVEYMKLWKAGDFSYGGNVYLKESVYHTLLYSSKSWTDFEKKFYNPFFYHALNRTYFVRYTFDVSIRDILQKPERYAPAIIAKYNDKYIVDVTKDGIDPEDFIYQPSVLSPEDELLINNPTFRPKNDVAMVRRGVRPVSVIRHQAAIAENNGAVREFKTKSYAGLSLDGSFTDIKYMNDIFSVLARNAKGLEFHTFYHPFSNQFVTNLNNGGVHALMASDTLRTAPTSPLTYKDNGTTFINNYAPNFPQGLVKQIASTDDYKAGEAYTYYKENVCFDVYGANSIYNWELFFHVPLYIATRLTKNGKYKEAMHWFHYIFDPTTDDLPLPGQPETTRYWKVLPFKNTPTQTLEEWFKTIGLGPSAATENAIVKEWRQKPFMPFVVARNRPLAFMKHVVIKYVENLCEWGDSLFRQFTRETVNEALHLYVIANHILGARPEFVPKRGKIKAETYYSLKDKWDDFGNALVDLENIFPYSSEVPVSTGSTSPSLLGIGSTLYFFLPSNDKLLEHWDTVVDRLYKIRHCMDIDGVKRQLALFAPPIDPAMLINAAAQGLDLGSILADLSSPPPIYRFNYLVSKANEFCAEVKSLGSTLLLVLEKKDVEDLGRLKASHESMMLDLMSAIKERQVLDAKATRETLLKSRETAVLKLNHYTGLLKPEVISVALQPALDADVNAESQLPADTQLEMLKTDVDGSLVDSDEAGVKIIHREKQQIEDAETALIYQGIATGLEGVAGGLHLVPDLSVDAKPFGVGVGTRYGGSHFGSATSGLAKVPQIIASVYAFNATQSAQMAAYIRREQEWTLQVNLAAKDIIQIDKQITSAEIRIQIAEKDLHNHKQQIENAKQVEQFLKDKFTKQELYQWMKEQLFTVYKQSFNMAYDMAKKVEKSYQYELGITTTNFIQYGYWDNTIQGLCAGEKLQLALRQLEKSHLEENKRELELSKSISTAMLNPLALQELRSTGHCLLTIPEELFDLDYQGHYFRRIKSVSISLPCIAGPHTTVSCTLRLLKNVIRINTTTGDLGNYEHNNDEGIWIDDDRFRESNVASKAIATSSGQHDSGMFELNFNDPRYVPFEGAGVIAEWKIELTHVTEFRQFDYSTISDVIFHINYTAREDAGLFKERAVAHLKDFLSNATDLDTQPLLQMFNLKREFGGEWSKFMRPIAVGADQVLSFKLQPNHFPFFTKGRLIEVTKVQVLVKAKKTGDYNMLFEGKDNDDNTLSSPVISMPENVRYGNMQTATLISPGVNVEDLDIFKQIDLKLRHNSVADFHSLGQDEIVDMYLVLHYKLGTQ